MNTELLKALANATTSGGFMYLSAADYGPLVQAGFVEVNGSMANPNGDGSVAARATAAGIEHVKTLSAPVQQPVTDFSGQPPAGFGGAPVANTGNPLHGIGNQTAANMEANGFTIGSGFRPAPKTSKPRNAAEGEGEKYPFSKLDAPVQNPDGSLSYSFVFVPSTKHTKGDKAGQLRTADEMAFSLQSACHAATRRFAEVAGETKRADGKVVKKYNHTRKFAVQGGEQNGVVGAYIYREA